jgi:hydrogenase maturation factor
MHNRPLPIGKLPPALLARVLAAAPINDPDVIVGPGVGLDCAVVDAGDRLFVFKSDPITFVSDKIGWYLVQVNANDLVTTGATPRWLLVTALLPDGATDAVLVDDLMLQLKEACAALDIALIGGHTEITHGLTRVILAGTLIGEVAREHLVTPRGARPGDRLLITKGVPIEGTAILAREFADRLTDVLSAPELAEAARFLYRPGISVVAEARAAVAAGEVTAMHDPTEGGVAAALWELADASGKGLLVDTASIPVPGLARRICEALGLDPLQTIASGALLLTVDAADVDAVQGAIRTAGVQCAVIGEVLAEPEGVWLESADGMVPMARPERDALARLYEVE